MIQRITGREDAQQLSAGDLVELANLIAYRDAASIAWVPVSERMPAPNESQSDYFWCWGPKHDMPELLEVYGYESWELPGTGFCSSCGVATHGSITHWKPAIPPEPPTR